MRERATWKWQGGHPYDWDGGEATSARSFGRSDFFEMPTASSILELSELSMQSEFKTHSALPFFSYPARSIRSLIPRSDAL